MSVAEIELPLFHFWVTVYHTPWGTCLWEPCEWHNTRNCSSSINMCTACLQWQKGHGISILVHFVIFHRRYMSAYTIPWTVPVTLLWIQLVDFNDIKEQQTSMLLKFAIFHLKDIFEKTFQIYFLFFRFTLTGPITTWRKGITNASSPTYNTTSLTEYY